MNRWLLGFGISVVVVVVAIVGVFWAQNAHWTARLSLNLGFFATRMPAEAPVPALLLLAFFLGFLTGGAWLALRTYQLASRVRYLEQQLALSGAKTPETGWR